MRYLLERSLHCGNIKECHDLIEDTVFVATSLLAATVVGCVCLCSLVLACVCSHLVLFALGWGSLFSSLKQ